jgi:hypothetical protein
MAISTKTTPILLAACLAFGIVGVFLLSHVYDAWIAGEMWLKPRFEPKRLLTYASSPSEFVLRLVFIGSGAVAFVSGAAAGVLGLVERAVLPRNGFSAGPSRSVVAAPLAVVALAAFCIWLALLFYLPFAYA